MRIVVCASKEELLKSVSELRAKTDNKLRISNRAVRTRKELSKRIAELRAMTDNKLCMSRSVDRPNSAGVCKSAFPLFKSNTLVGPITGIEYPNNMTPKELLDTDAVFAATRYLRDTGTVISNGVEFANIVSQFKDAYLNSKMETTDAKPIKRGNLIQGPITGYYYDSSEVSDLLQMDAVKAVNNMLKYSGYEVDETTKESLIDLFVAMCKDKKEEGLNKETEEEEGDQEMKEEIDLKNVNIAAGLGNLFGINIVGVDNEYADISKESLDSHAQNVVNHVYDNFRLNYNVELPEEVLNAVKESVIKKYDTAENLKNEGTVIFGGNASDNNDNATSVDVSKAAGLNEFVQKTEKEAIDEAKDTIRYQRTECGKFIKYFPNLDIYIMAATQELMDTAFDNAPANLLESFNVDMIAKSAVKGKVLERNGYHDLFEITDEEPTHVLVTLTTSGDYNKYQYETLYKALPDNIIIAELTNKQDEVYSATVAIPLDFELYLNPTGAEIKHD